MTELVDTVDTIGDSHKMYDFCFFTLLMGVRTVRAVRAQKYEVSQ